MLALFLIHCWVWCIKNSIYLNNFFKKNFFYKHPPQKWGKDVKKSFDGQLGF